MNVQRQYRIKLYLTNRKTPFDLIFENPNQIELFKKQIATEDIVSVGPLTFLSKNFKYFIEK